jgi:tripartite-type tricarboxylate transporter receptor subunit TctC
MTAAQRAVILAWCLPLCGQLAAQEAPFPGKGPVEITVPGSVADAAARVLAEGMARQLGVQVLVVNRPGAGGAIGYKHVASQRPDGHAVVWISDSISTSFHSGQLGFDYHAFDPVARVLVEPTLLAVRADAKWRSLGEFVADAKARPGRISVANSGTGSHSHIASVAQFRAAKVTVEDVPHGAAQVLPSLLSGHVDAAVQPPGILASHVKSGAVRVLAALSPEAWRGIAVPHGTPIGAVAVLESAIRRTVESPEFARASEKYAVRPAFLASPEFGELIARDDAELARLMQLIGLKK